MVFNEHLQTMFDKLETFFRTETVVGEPIVVGEVTLIPLIEISFGLGSGGGKGKDKKVDGAGGAGAGAKITPTAVMVVRGEEVSLIPLKERDSWEQVLNLAPELINKLKNKKKGEKTSNSNEG
ncbi:MAG: spore germination protein GerW family protein [Clostridia bacterium]|nr:spore germination protein GerW family protein [Clostridia bacterium]